MGRVDRWYAASVKINVVDREPAWRTTTLRAMTPRAGWLAGVDLGKRSWQTLRQPRKKIRAMIIPQQAASKQTGHSITASGRHYANHLPVELFDRATTAGDDDDNSTQRYAQQKAQESQR